MNESDLQRQLENLGKAALPAGLEDRLLAGLPAQVQPVRPLPGLAVRMVITLLLMAGAAVLLGFGAGGKGWRALDAEQRWSLLAMLLLFAGWFAEELSARMVPAGRLYAIGIGHVVLALAGVLGWTFFSTPYRADSKLFYLVCMGYTTAGVGVTFWLTRWWMRRGLPVVEGFCWPMAGAAGLAGFAAVELFCPYVDITHIVTSHVLPAAVAGLAVARWAGSRQKTGSERKNG